ncbi:hypothetical protein HPB48_004299 [Haemaphysalis longicornis]|uniref:Uncharacterized protein n=1 Tax=Haemaphysalis longicornis TaxID=44386 RepID=A0A9J6H6H9_HAELO|nr:hypothetical protein HPB48_004299 [Haemaphysalis longicornis]
MIFLLMYAANFGSRGFARSDIQNSEQNKTCASYFRTSAPQNGATFFFFYVEVPSQTFARALATLRPVCAEDPGNEWGRPCKRTDVEDPGVPEALALLGWPESSRSGLLASGVDGDDCYGARGRGRRGAAAAAGRGTVPVVVAAAAGGIAMVVVVVSGGVVRRRRSPLRAQGLQRSWK